MRKKSLLNLHFKGFGTITPSDSNRALKTVHFGIGDVQKAPTATRFNPILAFFSILARTNGCLVGENQWLLRWRQPMVASLEGTILGPFFQNIRAIKNPIGSFHQFFASISPVPMKNPVPKKSPKMAQKKTHFCDFFFSPAGFFAWEFS